MLRYNLECIENALFHYDRFSVIDGEIASESAIRQGEFVLFSAVDSGRDLHWFIGKVLAVVYGGEGIGAYEMTVVLDEIKPSQLGNSSCVALDFEEVQS